MQINCDTWPGTRVFRRSSCYDCGRRRTKREGAVVITRIAVGWAGIRGGTHVFGDEEERKRGCPIVRRERENIKIIV